MVHVRSTIGGVRPGEFKPDILLAVDFSYSPIVCGFYVLESEHWWRIGYQDGGRLLLWMHGMAQCIRLNANCWIITIQLNSIKYYSK
jgi:hypothetical protein